MKLVNFSLLSMLMISTVTFSNELSPVVQTTQGSVQGTYSTDHSIAIYKGIPYAQAPVGNLRWHTPQPAESWSGIKKTQNFSAGCMQSTPSSIRLPWTKEYLHTGPVSEDCLYLNIWTPQTHLQEKKPVIVFIHGGGFVEGSSSVPIYDGANLARKGVVFVNLNYRLGVFGFLSSKELQSSTSTSGNYGLLDQIVALKWINENIEKFGGDRKNITIMGQSAGANSVLYLNASPLTQGLFTRSVIESPTPTFMNDSGVKTEKLFDNFFTNTTIDVQSSQVDAFLKSKQLSIQKLRNMKAQAVFDLFKANQVFMGPVIGGDVFTKPLYETFSTKKSEKRPIMLGVNKDELSGFYDDYRQGDVKSYQNYVHQNFSLNAYNVLRLYPGNARKKLNTDTSVVAIKNLSMLLNKYTESPVYVYYFAYQSGTSTHQDYGVFHTSEVPYITRNMDKLMDKPNADDTKKSDEFSKYLLGFVKNGTPDTTKNQWKANEHKDWLYVIDKKSHMSHGISAEKETLISLIGVNN
jgi:para-nitrobenzyl esterase